MDASSEPLRPRVAIIALGCRVSRADADALASALGDGLSVARAGERADVVVVNTCTITADADAAARQAIRRAARDHPGAAIVAAGCYAQVRPEVLAALPGVAAVIGARSQAEVAGTVARLVARGPGAVAPGAPGERVGEAAAALAAEWGNAPLVRARHTRPFVKIQDGCDARCSYCVVPLARGGSRSLPLDEALRRLALVGARNPELVLTGVHLGAYGRDLSPRSSLAELVRAAVHGGLAARLRLSSIEPLEVPQELLADPEVTPSLCAHLHLPLQSGSDRVLAAMRRPYRADGYRRAVLEAAARLPGACLGADVLTGFPGETDADHRATVALVEALPLAYLHVFPFSPRPGTDAAALPGAAPAAVARARARELIALSDRRWRAFLGGLRGRELEVVVERVEDGVARGTSREYATVRWAADPAAGDARGALVRVRVRGDDGEVCGGVRTDPPPRSS
ncbi:MiaB/RimO family radical SAM methylthiotransferase [Anaeromyxobacter sp. SG66]|uniref:MiaB/RimO family radical SAM methylthiotransferase n=1 Tax=Anaeromyxobacter sp. SG66 TaxID=2925410 RepID=UPI001F55BB6D|nr:MiaB/RimO family radical SAM methylthiotransferase [Anaeromyxobacter sp. SG66]